MRKQTFTLLVFLLFTEAPVFAQLTTANDHGITIGHIHLLSRDPDAQKKIWIEALGAQPTKTGTLEMLRLPGVFIIINKAEPSAGSVGSTVDHFGLSVSGIDAIVADLKAKGVVFSKEPTTIRPGVRVCFIRGPQGVSIELLDRNAA